MIAGLNKKAFYWILQVSGWAVYALIHIFFLFVAGTIKIEVVTIIILGAVFYLISTHLYRLFILKFSWLRYPAGRLIPLVLLSTFILGIIHYLFEIGIGSIFGVLDIRSEVDIFSILVYVFASMVFYLLWASVYFMYHFIERMNTSLKYEAAFYEIELNKLKSQLNPHFMFNALNSIRALVDENPAKSKKAITQLSNLLRNSLIMNKRKLIDLRDEMKTVNDYLALEGIRLEERLIVDCRIEPEAELFQVPPLMLQTLVENGIKHGVATLKNGGKISIHATVKNNILTIEIRNNGQLNAQQDLETTGYGIENTKRRLNLLFGDAATFYIGNENDKVVLTRISVPLKYEHESAYY